LNLKKSIRDWLQDSHENRFEQFGASQLPTTEHTETPRAETLSQPAHRPLFHFSSCALCLCVPVVVFFDAGDLNTIATRPYPASSRMRPRITCDATSSPTLPAASAPAALRPTRCRHRAHDCRHNARRSGSFQISTLAVCPSRRSSTVRPILVSTDPMPGWCDAAEPAAGLGLCGLFRLGACRPIIVRTGDHVTAITVPIRPRLRRRRRSRLSPPPRRPSRSRDHGRSGLSQPIISTFAASASRRSLPSGRPDLAFQQAKASLAIVNSYKGLRFNILPRSGRPEGHSRKFE